MKNFPTVGSAKIYVTFATKVYCATRLRFEVKDNAKVDEKAVKAAGAAGVIRPSKNACQVIIGTKVQFVYDELKKML